MQYFDGVMNSRLAAVTWQTPAPVGSFPPNGYGLYDTAVNVLKWTRTGIRAIMRTKWKPLVARREDRAAARGTEFDPEQPAVRIPRKVIKGGSHLLAANCCRRYRPATRHPQMVNTSTYHIGFR